MLFLVQVTGGSAKWPDPENAVGNQDIGRPDQPVSSGLQVHGEPEHCLTRSVPPWWTFRGVLPSKFPSIAPAEIINTPLQSLDLWKVINEGDPALYTKIEMRNFPEHICTFNIFGEVGNGWVSSYAATPLIITLSSSYRHITSFRPWSSFATGNDLHCA